MLKVDTFASSDLIVEIGYNAAVVVNKLEFWMEKGYGEEINGVVYIWNPMRVWHEQLPWLSLRHLKRVFKKLVDLELVFKRKHGKGYDQTRSYGINYSHPIVTKCHYGLGQNVTMDSDKMSQCYNTDTTKENDRDLPQVSKKIYPTDKNPYQTTTRSKWKTKETRDRGKTTSRDWTVVKAWIRDKPQDFKDQLEKFVESQVNNPKRKVQYPTQYGMGVVHNVWHDEVHGTRFSDFKYLDKTGLSETVNRPVIETRVVTYEEKMGADHTFDDEMLLLQQGG